MTAKPYFDAASFRFLRALAKNNQREWFHEHKQEYQDTVRDPFLRLISDLAAPVAKISPHFRADPRPVGGSLFRIQRDTRFSNNKQPYKTWVGARIFHERGRETDAPVFYIHIQPGGSFIGAGIWHPQSEALNRLRTFLADNPQTWIKATRNKNFAAKYKLGGESLTRPPRGFPLDHPIIDDLKRKDFVATLPLADSIVLSGALKTNIAAAFKDVAPLVDYLCAALDLEF